jgi:hypothetical protein
MTRKRDLKKRIRDRQAKTGETYTTARRHVLAARDEEPDTDEAKAGADKTGEPGTEGNETESRVRAAKVGEPRAEGDEVTNPGIAVERVEDLAANPRAINVVDLVDEAAAKPVAATGEVERVASSRFGAELGAVPGTAELRKLVESRRPIEVDEVIDVTDAAKSVGLACKVLIYPRLVKAADTTMVLQAVKTALAATTNDPATYLLRAVIAGKAQELRMTSREVVLRDPEFMEKIAAGLTAVSKDGRMLALHVNGYAGMVTVVCAAWRRANTLMITTPEDRLGPVLAGFAAGESLFLVYEGRRYKIGRGPFVIGRHKTCDLQIKDGNISRKHAAIVQRHGVFYIVDLGSLAGIDYRGMRISNKRIDEGDLFKLREYALRFTFHETDA